MIRVNPATGAIATSRRASGAAAIIKRALGESSSDFVRLVADRPAHLPADLIAHGDRFCFHDLDESSKDAHAFIQWGCSPAPLCFRGARKFGVDLRGRRQFTLGHHAPVDG